MNLLNIRTMLIAVLLFAVIGSAQAQSLSKEEVLMIKAEINVLVDEYAYYRDTFNAPAYANLFSEDGKLVIGGNPVEGRAAIQKRVEDANQASVGMHMMATGIINVLDANNATGVHYAAVFGITPEEGADPSAPVPNAGPVTQGKYTDKYVNTDDGWKLAERSFTRVYVPVQ